MKFFEEHFTFHHLRHHPHKWVAALFLSPIHFAEMRYKQQYHLKFSHAKKLFVFDMLLMLSTVVLFSVTLFWWLYDPTVTALVHLDVEATVASTRFRSGDDVTLTITYNNESDVTLTNAQVILLTSPGFVITTSSLPYTVNTDNAIHITVDDIQPTHTETVSIFGKLYASPNDHTAISTMLVYTQDGKHSPESDIHRLYLTTREPSLRITLDGPPQYIVHTDVPIAIHVTNDQEYIFPEVDLDIQEEHGYATWVTATSTIGQVAIEEGKWHIPHLDPHTTATLSGTIQLSPPSGLNTFSWAFVPLIHLPRLTVPENQQPFVFPLATPHVRLSSSWDSTHTILGEHPLLTLSVENTGNAPLEHPHISVLDKTISLDKTLSPVETVPVTIQTYVTQESTFVSQEGPLFAPRISFSANLPNLPNYTYSTTAETTPLRVGSTISLSQTARYYTKEGDQLGRGPLPPQVEKETKYWVFTQIKNTVGYLEAISFTTTLAPNAVWTGKSSVSKGGDITYNSATRTASWSARSMKPYETVGIYFEVSIIPTTADLGHIPILTTKATLSARDPYVDDLLSTSFGSVTASLVGDPIGQAKGVQVR